MLSCVLILPGERERQVVGALSSSSIMYRTDPGRLHVRKLLCPDGTVKQGSLSGHDLA